MDNAPYYSSLSTKITDGRLMISGATMEYTPIRTLLIYPPSTQLQQSCPMGLLMLAAVLEKAGMEVHLMDACAAQKKRNMKEVIKDAVALNPDIIGITLLTPAVRESYKLAAALKERGFKLIAGGPHATLMPEEVLAHNFEAVVLGEGEPIIEQALKALMGHISKDQVPGWAYKDSNNKAVYTTAREPLANLDSLPFPARHMVIPSDYGESNQDVLHSNIFSSRGCPALCSFCAGGLFGKHFRFRSAKNIIEEMVYVHKTYGTRNFHFVDDAMTVNRERIREFCEGLIKLQLPITWGIMTRVDTVNEDLLKLLFKAGCTQIDYGVESGHTETLKRIHKPHTIEMVRKIIPLTAQHKIKPFVFFILGFPWESADDTQVTFDLMKELSPYVECFHPAVASIIIPFPGTEIYDKYKNEYGFENWWLSTNRHYERNGTNGEFYFENRLFVCGHVLKANFFNYSDDMKQKIYEIFTFMYKHNNRKHNPVMRFTLNYLLSISKNTAKISPVLEKTLFAPINALKKLL
jgi:anaerobic magnesium-protoporphyrin IX monomethyl ester cyclase